MAGRRCGTRVWLTLALLALSAAAGPGALAQEAPVRLRATVQAVAGDDLGLTTREGQKLIVRLAPDATVTAVVPARLEAVTAGAYVGTAALRAADGRLVAQEVLIFPEAMRGTGEGHFPWDLTPGSTMTNAAVAAAVAAVEGRILTLTYKGGEQTVVVPDGVPIVTFEPADRSLVVPGAHVFLSARRQPDGSWTAARIAVGKDGLVPPM